MNNEATILTKEDIDKFVKYMMDGKYDLKKRPCVKCGTLHFPNYGGLIFECDECFFSRFPKDQIEAFYRSFFE